MILIALAFLFIDIPLSNGLDIIPDAVGYLLMFFYFLKAAKNKERTVWLALASLAAAALSVFSYFDTGILVLRISRFILLIAAEFFLTAAVFQLEVKRAGEKYFPPSEDEIKASRSLILTGLSLVIFCELALPLAALIGNFVRVMILIFKNFGGLMVLITTAKMHNLRQY